MGRPKLNTELNLSDADNKRRLMAQIGPLQGKYRVRLEPAGETRSGPQNRWYFKFVVPALMEFFEQQGQHFTKEQAHDMLADEFLGETVIDHNTGQVMARTRRSTTTLTVAEFSDYIEKCLAWMAHYGVTVDDAEKPARPAVEVARG